MRVATYNLYLGADLSLLFGATEEELGAVVDTLEAQLHATDFALRSRAIARLLVRHQVDVVALQEVTMWTRNGEVVSDFLADLMAALAVGDCPYHVVGQCVSFTGSGAGMTITGSNAIIARPGIEARSVREGRFEAALVVPTPLGDIAVRRSWLAVDLSGFTFVDVHTEAYDEDVRNAQRDELLAALGEGPTVIAGDFNAEPETIGMPEPWQDAWLAAGGEPDGGHTWGQDADLSNERSRLRERIDYLWVRGVSVSSCQVIGGDPGDLDDASRLWPSDHAGVIADVDVVVTA